MAMSLLPDYIDNWRTDLEDHPAVWVGIQRPQSGEESGARALCDSDHLPVEKGNAFSCAKFLPVQARAIANFFSNFQIDVSIAHRQSSD